MPCSSFRLLVRFQTTNDDIPDAQIVRERFVSAQQRHDDEWNKLEQELQQALSRHKSLLDSVEATADEKNDNKKTAIYTSLQHLRDCYEKMMYWEEALRLEQELLDQFESSSSEMHAANLYRQGKLHMRMTEYSKAIKLYQQALEMYNNDTCLQNVVSYYHAVKGNILISMAGIPFHRGQWEESLQWLEQAEPHFVFHGRNEMNISSNNKNDDDTNQKDNDTIVPHPDLIKCLKHHGLLHRTMQEFDLALECYQRAWQVLEQLQKQNSNHNVISHETRQSLLMDLADMHLARDDYNPAERLYQQVLQEEEAQRSNSFTETTNNALQGVILHNLGKIHAQRQEYEAAVEKLEQAVAIKQQLVGEFHPEVAKTLNALGAVYAVQDVKVKALECFQQALLIARTHSTEKDGSDPQIMLALRNIALVKGEKVPRWGDSSTSSE